MAALASSAHFTGSSLIINAPHSQSQPTSVKFRPLRVSASAGSSTAERTRPQHHITSPGSLYEVLGIQMGATSPEIKAAYRKLARVMHPDVAAKRENENTAYGFMKLHEAYETLSDPEKRADYDRTLFRRRRPLSSRVAVSGVANTMNTSANSGFCGYTRRTWETDQCWSCGNLSKGVLTVQASQAIADGNVGGTWTSRCNNYTSQNVPSMIAKSRLFTRYLLIPIFFLCGLHMVKVGAFFNF